MGLDVALRLKNLNTGEIRELDSYRGSNFTFVKQYMDSIDAYGQDIEVTPELREQFINQGLETLRKYGFETGDLGEDYGLMGFIKQLHLYEYYARFGYTLMVEADW
jgi:hypothetical protein